MVSKLRDICGLYIMICMLKRRVEWDIHLFFLSKADLKIKNIGYTNFSNNVILQGSHADDKKDLGRWKQVKKSFEHQLLLTGPL